MSGPDIQPGQIWREDDNRVFRLVKIIRVNSGYIRIRTVDGAGNFKKGSRETDVLRFRFGRAGGYLLAGDP